MIIDMSEAPAEVVTDFVVGIQTETPISQIKKDLTDPRTISKNKDQGGRDILSASVGEMKKESEEIKTKVVQTESELQTRQENILVRLKQKLNIPDKKTLELQEQLLEANARKDQLPDPKKMIEAYYQKAAETPLTNQEKRDLLKPEVLSQLSTDEYIALWRRLNPHFMTHATPQGFRDHSTGMLPREMSNFHNGFLDILKNEKQLKSRFTLSGLTSIDETTVTIFLSNMKVLQQEDESKALELFKNSINEAPLFQPLPGYPDGTSVHLAPQLVNDGYLGETGNGVFFCFPTDVIASQYTFGLAGDHKDLRKIQGDGKMWDDVFIWPNNSEIPGIPVDSGIVFLPNDSEVDPKTGSTHATETKNIEGKETKLLIENKELVSKYLEWSEGIFNNDEIVNTVRKHMTNEIDSNAVVYRCLEQLSELGFRGHSGLLALAEDITDELDNYYRNIENKQTTFDNKIYTNEMKENTKNEIKDAIRSLIENSFAKYEPAANTIPGKDYWERFFAANPNLKPRHIVYYDGNPTNAVYRFLQEKKIGSADTSKVNGPLLGFDDHFVLDIRNDPRGYKGYDELANTANKIIKEHYAFK
jgi:hypothetical protein